MAGTLIHLESIEDRVAVIIEAYKKLKPHDQTRSRGKSHIKKLLTSGKYSTYQLLLAVERYDALAQPLWGDTCCCDAEYHRESAWVDSKFVKGVGNFFGREALFKTYLKRGYKADIEEEDWVFFTQQWNYTQNANKTTYSDEYLWAHNMRLPVYRYVIRYGYSPAQLAGPFDRRYK